MPSTNEEFIKKAFAAGLTEDQVRAAVAERNQKLATTQQTKTIDTPNLLDNVANLLGIGTTAKNIKLATGAPQIGQQAANTRQLSDDTFKKSQALIKEANQTTDPVRKKALIDASRSLMQGVEAVTSDLDKNIESLVKQGGVNATDLQRDNLNFATKRGTGTFAESASALLPMTKEIKALVAASRAAGAVPRITTSAGLGGVQGMLQGEAQAATDSENVLDMVKKTLEGGVSGAVTSGVLEGVGTLTSKKPTVTKLESEMDNIDRIIYGADNPVQKRKAASDGFVKLYQSAFPFSKKGNAFERLKPAETVDDMIRYGIAGDSSSIKKQAMKITGKDGVLTNIVDEAIATTPNQSSVKIPQLKASDYANKFSELGDDKINEQIVRISNLKPGEKPTETTLKSMVELERALKKEGFEALTKGVQAQNLKSQEFGKLKLDLADKLGKIIDGQVSSSTIEKYKDPRIIEYIRSIGGDELAKDFTNAKNLSELRKLQTSFVRMSQIVDLSDQLPSGMGNKIFNQFSNIPIAGLLSEPAKAITTPIAQQLATGGAVGGKKLIDVISQIKSPSVNQNTQDVLKSLATIFAARNTAK